MEHPHSESTHHHNHAMILRTHKELIMERWRERLCHEIPAANAQSTSQLRNSIPKFLDRLAVALTDPRPQAVTFNEVNDISYTHGTQRATLKEYSMFEMLSEYRILREVIFETLEQYWPLSKIHRDVILTSIEAGMSEAGNRFAEAQRHRELKQKKDYEDLLNSIKGHAIIKTDAHGVVTDWNPGAEKIIGYKRDEIVGRPNSLIYTQVDRVQNYFLDEMERALRQGKAEDTRWHLRKDGSLFFASETLNPIFDDDGHHTGFVKILKDQTLLHKMETELDRRKAEFEAIFNAIPDVVIVADENGTIVACNPATVDFFGYEPEELIGKSTSVVSADDCDFTLRRLERSVSRYKKKNGDVIISETNSTTLRDVEGGVIGCLSIIRDITERVKSQEILEEMADAMPQIVWTSDPSGNVVYYNKRISDYTGFSVSELKGQGWEKFLHPEDMKEATRVWDEALRGKVPYQVECRLRRFDGIFRWHLIRAIPVFTETGAISKWYGTNTDIEDQKQAFNKLVNERELRERFVSALSHDLRTPLTAAKLSGQLIKKMHAKDEKLGRSIDRIVSGIDRVDMMIQNLLDANRISVGEPVPINPTTCDLSGVIRAALDDLTHIHGDRFIFDDPHGQVEGYWDATSIRRVIENLCNNAVKYGDPEKKITVKLQKTSNDSIISVHNYGVKLTPEERKILFMPYKRISRDNGKKGWGLGLTLVKGMANAHRGSVSVESEAETGTVFTVKLPLDFRSESNHQS